MRRERFRVWEGRRDSWRSRRGVARDDYKSEIATLRPSVPRSLAEREALTSEPWPIRSLLVYPIQPRPSAGAQPLSFRSRIPNYLKSAFLAPGERAEGIGTIVIAGKRVSGHAQTY